MILPLGNEFVRRDHATRTTGQRQAARIGRTIEATECEVNESPGALRLLGSAAIRRALRGARATGWDGSEDRRTFASAPSGCAAVVTVLSRRPTPAGPPGRQGLS